MTRMPGALRTAARALRTAVLRPFAWVFAAHNLTLDVAVGGQRGWPATTGDRPLPRSLVATHARTAPANDAADTLVWPHGQGDRRAAA